MDAFRFALICEKAGARFLGFADGKVKFCDPLLKEKRIVHQWPAGSISTEIVSQILGADRLKLVQDADREAKDSGRYSGARVEID